MKFADGAEFQNVYGIGSPVAPQSTQAPDGSYILEISNIFVYTDGNKDVPQITRAIAFMDKGVNHDIDKVLKEVPYDIEEMGEIEGVSVA